MQVKNTQQAKTTKLTLNLVLILLVIALAVLPLYVAKDAEFEGADGKAEEAIGEINAAYEPWFEPLFEPQSGEIESALFALQAALGAAVLGYGFGYLKGCRRKVDEQVS